MIRLVVDTNVYISAAVFGGTPSRALQLIEALGLEVAYSTELRDEFIETLREKFVWPEERIFQACQRFWASAQHVILESIPRVARDADDDHVLACAVASGARILVTGDRDLLSLQQHQGVRIVTPAEFLSLFGVPSGQ